MRSPLATVVPGRTSVVITSEFEAGPDSRGAAIVVDSTASTVPLNLTLRMKSHRVTVKVALWRPAEACSSAGDWRAYRNTAAPPAKVTAAATPTAPARTDFLFKWNSPLSDDLEAQGVGGWQPSIQFGLPVAASPPFDPSNGCRFRDYRRPMISAAEWPFLVGILKAVALLWLQPQPFRLCTTF